jgi:hypothetical protein
VTVFGLVLLVAAFMHPRSPERTASG